MTKQTTIVVIGSLRVNKTLLVSTHNVLFLWRNKINNNSFSPGLGGLVGFGLTEDQEVAGLIPAGSATFFHGD